MIQVSCCWFNSTSRPYLDSPRGFTKNRINNNKVGSSLFCRGKSNFPAKVDFNGTLSVMFMWKHWRTRLPYDNLMARNNPAIHSNFEALTSKVECKIDNKKFLLKDFSPLGWLATRLRSASLLHPLAGEQTVWMDAKTARWEEEAENKLSGYKNEVSY